MSRKGDLLATSFSTDMRRLVRRRIIPGTRDQSVVHLIDCEQCQGVLALGGGPEHALSKRDESTWDRTIAVASAGVGEGPAAPPGDAVARTIALRKVEISVKCFIAKAMGRHQIN